MRKEAGEKKGKETWESSKVWETKIQRELFFARTLRERCQRLPAAKRKRNISSFLTD